MITLLETYTFEFTRDEQTAVLDWLKELRTIRVREAAELEVKVMQILTGKESGQHGLAEEEATRLWKTFGVDRLVQLDIEFESGPCRLCGGKGKVERVTRYSCIGDPEGRMERCFTCSGSGTDPKRIKVPEL